MPYADADARRAYYRQWKKGPKKKRSNKFYDAARHANERAAKYGVEGRITTADARTVLDGAACLYCGSTERLGIDHRIPLALGGPNELANLVAACHSCNSSKYRSDRPHRWSRKYDSCQDCGTSERRHHSLGLCERCWWRRRGGRRR